MFEEILGETFSAFFKNISYYCIIAVIIALPLSVATYGLIGSTMGFGGLTVYSDLSKMIFNSGDKEVMQEYVEKQQQQQKDFTPAKMAMYYFGSFIIALLGLLKHISTIIITDNAARGKSIDLAQAMALAVRKLPGIMVIGIIMGLACFAGSLLIVLGIYLGIKFSLTLPIYVVEDISIFDAISRSFQLTRGKEWSILGTSVVLGILGYVVAAIFGFIFLAAALLTSNLIVIIIMGSLVGAVATLGYFPLYVSVYYFYAIIEGSINVKGKLDPLWEAPKPDFQSY